MPNRGKSGLGGAILAVALILGGRGAHAGFRIGKSSTSIMAYFDQTAEDER